MCPVSHLNQANNLSSSVQINIQSLVRNTMVITTASSLFPVLAAASNDNLINNTILPFIESNRALAEPIELFGQDYNECNGILSAMSPSTRCSRCLLNTRRVMFARRRGRFARRRPISLQMCLLLIKLQSLLHGSLHQL